MNSYILDTFTDQREWFTSRVDALVRLARLNNMYRNSVRFQLREVY